MVTVEDEHMIQALSSEGADEPLAISAYLRYVSPWSSKGCLQFLDTTTSGDFREAMAILAVTVVNEILGRFAPGCGLAQLLCSSGIGRGARDGYVHHAA